MKNKKLPKWFNGELYQQGGEVTNPFSGESYELSAEELSIYDFIIGAQHVFGIHQEKQPNRPINVNLINDFDKALSWFRRHNGKAYMVLLD
jgi:hypothetical protein